MEGACFTNYTRAAQLNLCVLISKVSTFIALNILNRSTPVDKAVWKPFFTTIMSSIEVKRIPLEYIISTNFFLLVSRTRLYISIQKKPHLCLLHKTIPYIWTILPSKTIHCHNAVTSQKTCEWIFSYREGINFNPEHQAQETKSFTKPMQET